LPRYSTRPGNVTVDDPFENTAEGIGAAPAGGVIVVPILRHRAIQLHETPFRDPIDMGHRLALDSPNRKLII
jgi:hypothetical protein